MAQIPDGLLREAIRHLEYCSRELKGSQSSRSRNKARLMGRLTTKLKEITDNKH